MRNAFLLFLLVALSVPFLFAEDEPQLLILQERAPSPGADITVITRAQIEQSHLPFVIDLLRTVPGLHVIQATVPGTTSLVFARGSQPEQVLVLIDGARYNGDLQPIALADLTTTNVERIEIERGPQGAPLGSSAVGAVIRITTRHSGPLISAHGEYGSTTTRRFGIRSGAGSERNHYSVAFERYDSDGDVINSDYLNDTISARAKLMVTSWTSLGFTLRDINTDGGVSSTQPVPHLLQRRDARLRLFSIPVQQQITNWLAVEAQYSSLHQVVEGFRSDDHTFSISAHLRPSASHDLITGYERETLNTRLSENGTRADITNNAFLADYRWNATEQFMASLAFRVDDDSINGSRFSPRMTASYKINGQFRIHGSAGTGFRRPTADEVHFITVKRERAEGMDLGAEYSNSEKFSAGMVFFHTRYKDTILNLGFFGPRNLPPYTATGVELEAKVRPAEGIEVRGNYTLTHAKDFSLAPKHTGSIGLNFNHWKLIGNFDFYVVGESDITEAHTRADASIGFALTKSLQIYARATNMFDSEYKEFSTFPAPRRAGYFGIRWD